MTSISDIDEIGINRNLKIRYQRDEIYVSFFNAKKVQQKKNIIFDMSAESSQDSSLDIDNDCCLFFTLQCLHESTMQINCSNGNQSRGKIISHLWFALVAVLDSFLQFTLLHV